MYRALAAKSAAPLHGALVSLSSLFSSPVHNLTVLTHSHLSHSVVFDCSRKLFLRSKKLNIVHYLLTIQHLEAKVSHISTNSLLKPTELKRDAVLLNSRWSETSLQLNVYLCNRQDV